MSRITLLILFVVLAIAPRLNGQIVTGKLEGWVVDEQGAPLPGAQVTAHSSGYRERTVITDAQGHFVFIALPPDAYMVDVIFVGRRPVHLEQQRVRLGQTTTLGQLIAHTQAIEVAGITAVAEHPLVDVTTSTYGSVIDRKDMESLPVDRDYNSVAALLPHVANSAFYGDGLNFAGATGLENYFFADGMNTTNPYSARGDLKLPYNFIKEIQVRTGGYEAEYRSALGGVLNVVTQSGTNDLQVDAWAFYAGNRLGPRPTTNVRAVTRGEYSQYDVGASVAGPLKRDRMWYFASWNPFFETQNYDIPFNGSVADKPVSHRFAGKITWQPSRRTRLEFNALGNPTIDPMHVGQGWDWFVPMNEMPKPDPWRGYQRTGATAFSGRGTYFLKPWTVLEVGLNQTTYTEKTHRRSGDSTEPFFIDEYSEPGKYIWLGGYPLDINIRDGRNAGEIRLTNHRGAHEVKVGLDVDHAFISGDQSIRSVLHLHDGSWLQGGPKISNAHVVNRSYGAFAQDSWELSKRFRMNYGLRWNNERIFASDGTLAAKIDKEWAPRLTAIYQIGAIGTQKLTASAGRYYEQVPLNAPEALYTVGAISGVWLFDHDPRIDPTGGVSVTGDIKANTWAEPLRLQGLYYDEIALGYERLLNASTKASARVLHRRLGMALEDAAHFDGNFSWGNPGYGALAFSQKATRKYSALELSAEHTLSKNAFVLASYVLSRNYGNYAGFYASDYEFDGPNYNSNFDQPEMVSEGLLPNDRTHVFKAAAWYRFTRATIGGSFVWESGTPRSEQGASKAANYFHAFISQRGTLGRTPAIRDLNLRATYQLQRLSNSTLLLDLLHVASTQRPLLYHDVHYRELDANGKQTDPDPEFGTVTAWQGKTAARIGMQVHF